MSAQNYLAYAGAEIGNAHRIMAYLRNPVLARQLGECTPVPSGACGCAADDLGPYVSPEADPAPWYDESLTTTSGNPSADFLGVFITRITGIDDSPLSRSVTPSASAGGYLGRLKLGPRTLSFQATLWATSSCGMEYGKRWLTEALKGLPCDDCHTDEACLRSCCPVSDHDAAALVGLRHAFGVGLLDPPLFTDAFPEGQCCDTLVDVTWTMVAETPWLFNDPVDAFNSPLFIEPGGPTCFAWCDHTCPEVAGGCAPDDPPDTYCEPWYATPMTCCTIPAQPDWADAATLITVEAGAGPITRLIIKAWEPLAGEGCPDISAEAYACVEPCNVIEVHGMPTSSTLTIDGRSRRVTLRCQDGTIIAGDPFVAGAKGLLKWLEVGDAPICVCVYASVEDLADNVRVSVQYVPRVGG